LINKEQKSFSLIKVYKNPLFFLCLAFGLIFSLFTVDDPDIWWHLKTGEWIIQNHSLPRHDIFTYTVPPDVPWQDIQWQFQTLIALLYKIGGWNILIGIRVIWVWLLITIVWGWLTERGIEPFYNFLSTFIVIVGSRYRFTIRPELLTFAIMAFHIWLYEHGARVGKIPIVPLLVSQFYWANWHSSCILGLFLGGAFVISNILRLPEKRYRRTTKKEISQAGLVMYLMALGAVTLLNPNGWVTPLYALTEGQKGYILEFQPPGWGFFAGVTGLALLLSLLGWKRMFDGNKIFLPLLLAAFLFQTFRMFRFYPYLALCLAPLQAHGLKLIIEKTRSFRPVLRITSFGIETGCLIIIAAFNVHNDFKPMFRFGVNESGYPVEAVNFVLKENIRGNIYNEFSNGGYLLWRLAPERKVFIFGDTRLNSALQERVESTYDVNLWRSLFDEYRVTYAIMSCACPPIKKGENTIPALIHSWSDWKLVFWDDYGMVFVKELPEFKDLIARRASKILPEHIPFSNNPVPNLEIIQNMFVEPTSWQGVENELQRAIKDSPHHFRALFALGMLRISQKNFSQDTLNIFQMAQEILPGIPELHQLIAVWYFDQGKYDEAVLYTKKAMAHGLGKAEGLYKVALIYYRAGRIRETMKTLDQLLRLNPDHPMGLKLRSVLTRKIEKEK
jgi:hypothetical protein